MHKQTVRILFEDDYFVAADKPSGLSSQASLDKKQPHFYGLVREQFSYLALHHRLDKETSGVMLFAKSKEANIPLAQMFREHHIQKTYFCLCAPKKGPTQFVVKNYLAEQQKSLKHKARMILVQSGGQPAETHFTILKQFAKGQLVEAQPQTGRMHQIRVHLSSRGLGIFGDSLYASPTEPKAPRLMLHAARLEFTHPLTQSHIKIESPLPEDFVLFQEELSL